MAKRSRYEYYRHNGRVVYYERRKCHVEVDHKLLKIIEVLWLNGIDTRNCCQGNGKCESKLSDFAYIQFDSFQDLLKFLALFRGLKGPEKIFRLPLIVEPTFAGVVRFPSSWIKVLRYALLKKSKFEANPCKEYIRRSESREEYYSFMTDYYGKPMSLPDLILKS